MLLTLLQSRGTPPPPPVPQQVQGTNDSEPEEASRRAHERARFQHALDKRDAYRALQAEETKGPDQQAAPRVTHAAAAADAKGAQALKAERSDEMDRIGRQAAAEAASALRAEQARVKEEDEEAAVTALIVFVMEDD